MSECYAVLCLEKLNIPAAEASIYALGESDHMPCLFRNQLPSLLCYRGLEEHFVAMVGKNQYFCFSPTFVAGIALVDGGYERIG